MVIFNIDTGILRSSVGVAEQANEAITEAASLLNAITVHEDWKCKERDKIKDMTLANKSKAQEIQEHAQAFYAAVKTSSEKLDAAESDCWQRVNGLDDIISKVVNVVPSITEAAVDGAVKGIGSDIPIATFGDFDESLEG